MGEAKINETIRRATAVMPTPEEIRKIEAMSARFADALYGEGMKIGGAPPQVLARMLVFVTAGRVLAKIGADLHEMPEFTQQAGAAGMREAVIIAQRQAIVEEGRRLALAAEKGG